MTHDPMAALADPLDDDRDTDAVARAIALEAASNLVGERADVVQATVTVSAVVAPTGRTIRHQVTIDTVQASTEGRA